jgi:hypothetical protein
MAVPDWVSYATLGVSAVAAVGGTAAALITRRSNRLENRRLWERDHVTERYTELHRALLAIHGAYVESVEPLLGQDPMPSLDEGWKALHRAYGDLLGRWADANVVARTRVRRMMPYVMGINVSVLAPLSRPVGIPPIANERLVLEHRHVGYLVGILLVAIRTDLGLTDRKKTKIADAEIGKFIERAKKSRSAFAAGEAHNVVGNLRAYQVDGLAGADGDYRIPAELLNGYCAQLPQPLVGRDAEAFLIWSGDTLQAGVRTDLPNDRITLRLRQIGVAVESGFRNDSGWGGYRVLPDGSRAFLWTSGSLVE